MYPSYTSIYHAIPSYDGICEYMSGYQGVRIPDVHDPISCRSPGPHWQAQALTDSLGRDRDRRARAVPGIMIPVTARPGGVRWSPSPAARIIGCRPGQPGPAPDGTRARRAITWWLGLLARMPVPGPGPGPVTPERSRGPGSEPSESLSDSAVTEPGGLGKTDSDSLTRARWPGTVTISKPRYNYFLLFYFSIFYTHYLLLFYIIFLLLSLFFLQFLGYYFLLFFQNNGLLYALFYFYYFHYFLRH